MVFGMIGLNAFSQRAYKNNSVLGNGSWFKISVKDPGVYKIDIPFLNTLGVNTQNLSSSAVRIFGNGGYMLPEANAISRIDDLEENAVMTVDGGDGVLNSSDYILFYAAGPHEWLKDSVNKKFMHQENIYTEKSFYFLTIDGQGKRIQTLNNTFSPNLSVTSFDDRYFHELDTVNFLASGKEWYGEEFANLPGRVTVRNFDLSFPNIQPNSPATLVTNCIARSVGAASRFDIKLNNQPLLQMNIFPVGNGQYDLFAQQSTQTASAIISQSNFQISYNFVPASFNAQGWLNWYEFFCRRNLSLIGVNQLLFRDWLSVGNGNTSEFIISGSAATTQVWDITDLLNPVNMQGTLINNNFRFVNQCNMLREYVAFTGNEFLKPEPAGRINNQDLHNTAATDYIIITHSSLLAQANRLAQFHQQKNNYRTKLVTAEQVYNEFSSGSPDATALRDFLKMYFDKYSNTAADKLKYVLLLGDASFDYKDRIRNNTSLIPGYENSLSLDPLSTYTSDDFYGFLNDNEDINSGTVTNLLDIGIGRVPAKNETEAKNFVDKVIAYYDKQSFGPWRNNLTLIADDEDQNLHFQDGETFAATITGAASGNNLQKIYLDAFKQENGSGGSRYPDANDASNNSIYNGTLIWNYSGHGGHNRLAEETILDQEIVNKWNNPNRLPLFITATCDFAPYDNPAINSIGENILLRPKTGGIALMTTTRLVFSFSNRVINNNYLATALQPDANNKFKTLGEAVMAAKNFTYQSSGDIINNRKFTLLGDPGMRLGFPELKIRVTKVNGMTAGQTDTLNATEKAVLEGEVTDVNGNLLNSFNGTVYASVFDKLQQVTSLANDPSSIAANFILQNSILFKGKASATAGKFSFSFKMPKDINYQFGKGKLSLYADDGITDASGSFTGFIIGGVGSGLNNDNAGPVIKAWLNDEKFVNGSITNQNPVLLVKLSDSSGINTTGAGIGHDIVATLDNSSRYFVLNDFFETDLNDYKQGLARFQLPELEPGAHFLKIKAWDVMNNSAEYLLEFTVTTDKELEINHVLNYPNPFSTKTQFWFEHNRPGQNLKVEIRIFSVAGRLIKTLKSTINTPGNRSYELEWDGRDFSGDKIGRGVYLYKLSVTTPENQRKQTIGKLVIF
jgi:hypothetical protein